MAVETHRLDIARIASTSTVATVASSTLTPKEEQRKELEAEYERLVAGYDAAWDRADRTSQSYPKMPKRLAELKTLLGK